MCEACSHLKCKDFCTIVGAEEFTKGELGIEAEHGRQSDARLSIEADGDEHDGGT